MSLSWIAPLSDYGSYTGAIGHTFAMGIVAFHVLRAAAADPVREPAVAVGGSR